MTDVSVRLRYYAGASAAAGRDEEPVVVPAGTTTATLVSDACARHGADLTRVAAACSVLVDGVPDAERNRVLSGSVTVDLLPPFAGG